MPILTRFSTEAEKKAILGEIPGNAQISPAGAFGAKSDPKVEISEKAPQNASVATVSPNKKPLPIVKPKETPKPIDNNINPTELFKKP